MADDDGDRSLGIEDGFNEFGDIIGVDQTRLFGDQCAAVVYSSAAEQGRDETRWVDLPVGIRSIEAGSIYEKNAIAAVTRFIDCDDLNLIVAVRGLLQKTEPRALTSAAFVAQRNSQSCARAEFVEPGLEE